MSGPQAPAGPPEAASKLALRLVKAGGGTVRAVLLYGSQLLRARPDAHSAYDFVVLVEDYRGFYAALKESGELPRPVWLMAAMARVLPPNVIAFAPGKGREEIAKSLILTPADFERALGASPRDHFLLGRMVQHVATVWAASDEGATWVGERLRDARLGVLRWMAPWLEGSFDAPALGRRVLEVCYQGELRPEAQDRAENIFQAQAGHFRATFPEVLEAGVRDGLLERAEEGRYRLVRPAAVTEQRRWRRHFRRSKRRATLRWFKHMVTFANWLPYIVRKVERHTGKPIHLTTLERKLPLIFLWPRAIHVLLSRPPREEAVRSGEGGEARP